MLVAPGVVKKTLQEGTGWKLANEGATVTLRCVRGMGWGWGWGSVQQTLRVNARACNLGVVPARPPSTPTSVRSLKMRIPPPGRYRATLPDGTVFEEAVEGGELTVVVDEEMVGGQAGAGGAGLGEGSAPLQGAR